MRAPETGAPSATREDWYALDGAGVPEDRVLSATLRVALAISLMTFIASSSAILLDQWISGQVPAVFMLGTMLVLLGFSVGLFAAILAIGLIVSVISGATAIAARKIIAYRPVDGGNPGPLRDLVLRDTAS